jgi:hypothetical protein
VKVVLVVVGLIFCGLAYPLMMFVKQDPALAMTQGDHGDVRLAQQCRHEARRSHSLGGHG